METREIMRQLFVRSFAQDRHFEAPLLSERESYLTFLLREGASISYLKWTAGYLLNIMRLIGLTQPRTVALDEIENASERWYKDEPGHRLGRPASSRSIYRFALPPRIGAASTVGWSRSVGDLSLDAITCQHIIGFLDRPGTTTSS